MMSTIDPDVWQTYWGEHPRLMWWHAQTFARREKPAEAYTPPPISDGKTQFRIQVSDVDAASPINCFRICQRQGGEIAFFCFKYDQERCSTIQFFGEENAKKSRDYLFYNEIQVGEVADAIPLECDVLHLKGSFLSCLWDAYQNTNSIMNLFSVFGPCKVSCVDPVFHLTITFIDPKFKEQDARFCLQQLQPWLATDWSLLLFFPPKANIAYVRPKDVAPVTVEVSDSDSLTLEEAPAKSRFTTPGGAEELIVPICPQDGNCAIINDHAHQKKFRHTCTFAAPCQFLNNADHAKKFIHK